MVKRKISVKKYSRVRKGKKEIVRKHDREIQRVDINQSVREEITMGKARQIFESRSEMSKEMDLDLQTTIMFAVPNGLWARMPNRFDIWGLDGFEPPKVKKLPIPALPFQVVKYKGQIYTANQSGKFTIPEKKSFKLFDKEKQEEFTTATGKNAIWRGNTTRAFEKWLEKENKIESISNQLNYKRSQNKLYEIQELYNSLNLPQKELKELMFKLYNKIYKNKIHSYTKDFNEFYDRRFYTNVEDKIKAEKNRIKELNKDPKKTKEGKERYKTSELRFFNIMSKMEGLGHYDFNINEIRGKMEHLEDDEIVQDLIAELHDEKGDLGAGEVDYTYSDKKKFDAMKGYYEQRSHDEYLEHLTQEALQVK